MNDLLEDPPDDELLKLAWKYLRISDIPDYETLVEIFAWERLEAEVLEAHAAWLVETGTTERQMNGKSSTND